MGAAGPGKAPEAAAKRAMLPPPTAAGRRCSGGMRQAAAAGDEAAGPATSGGCWGAADPAQAGPTPSWPTQPNPCPHRTRRPRAWLDHPTRLARGRRLRCLSQMVRSQWNASAMIGAAVGGQCQLPQRGAHDAAATGRVGWSSPGAAVAGTTRGPCPPCPAPESAAPRVLDHPTRLARGRRLRRCRKWAVAMERERHDRRRSTERAMPAPQRGMHDAAATGRVGWSSPGAAVAGGTRGPCPPGRRVGAVRAPGRRPPAGCPRGRARR